MMEASSPLAAMRPPAFHRHHSYGNNNFMPMAAPKSFGPNDFNFKDLSMKMALKKSQQQDYFSMKPVPASSPTMELTAELSQNFHIDNRCVDIH